MVGSFFCFCFVFLVGWEFFLIGWEFFFLVFVFVFFVGWEGGVWYAVKELRLSYHWMSGR